MNEKMEEKMNEKTCKGVEPTTHPPPTHHPQRLV